MRWGRLQVHWGKAFSACPCSCTDHCECFLGRAELSQACKEFQSPRSGSKHGSCRCCCCGGQAQRVSIIFIPVVQVPNLPRNMFDLPCSLASQIETSVFRDSGTSIMTCSPCCRFPEPFGHVQAEPCSQAVKLLRDQPMILGLEGKEGRTLGKMINDGQSQDFSPDPSQAGLGPFSHVDLYLAGILNRF